MSLRPRGPWLTTLILIFAGRDKKPTAERNGRPMITPCGPRYVMRFPSLDPWAPVDMCSDSLYHPGSLRTHCRATARKTLYVRLQTTRRKRAPSHSCSVSCVEAIHGDRRSGSSQNASVDSSPRCQHHPGIIRLELGFGPRDSSMRIGLRSAQMEPYNQALGVPWQQLIPRTPWLSLISRKSQVEIQWDVAVQQEKMTCAAVLMTWRDGRRRVRIHQRSAILTPRQMWCGEDTTASEDPFVLWHARSGKPGTGHHMRS